MLRQIIRCWPYWGLTHCLFVRFITSWIKCGRLVVHRNMQRCAPPAVTEPLPDLAVSFRVWCLTYKTFVLFDLQQTAHVSEAAWRETVAVLLHLICSMWEHQEVSSSFSDSQTTTIRAFVMLTCKHKDMSVRILTLNMFVSVAIRENILYNSSPDHSAALNHRLK